MAPKEKGTGKSIMPQYTTYKKEPVKWLKWVFSGTILAGFIALTGFAIWQREDLLTENIEPPLIAAGTGPSKVRPDQPGGMDIPHQDKRIFDLLTAPADGKATPDITSLIKQQEAEEKAKIAQKKSNTSQPTEKKIADTPPAATASPVAVKAKEETKETNTKLITALTPTTKAHGKTKTAPSSTAEGQFTTVTIAKKETPLPVTSENTGTPTPIIPREGAPSVKPDGRWGVQLASFKTKKDANAAIATFQKKFGPLLGSMESSIQSATVKGSQYYRVRFYGLKNKQAALDTCSALKKQQQGCLQVTR